MLKDTILKRRSVRKYKDKEVDKEKLEELLMYASMGPSNGNSHPVEFIVVDDKEKIEELSNMDSFATLSWINVKEGKTAGKISYEEYFAENFGIKKPYRAQCLIPIGYKKSGTKDHEEFDISTKVHYNKF